MTGQRTPSLQPGGGRVRFLRFAPRLVLRCLRLPGKRKFFRSLLSTYYTNYINLSLVFRPTRSDGEIRRLALRNVLTYVRNEAVYRVPRAWRGFDLYNPQALDKALAAGKGVVIANQHLGPERCSFVQIALSGREVHAAITVDFMDRAQMWLDRMIDDFKTGPAAEAARRVFLMSVEEPTCALKMVRALRRGDLVMFNIDGNIGVGHEGRTLEEEMTLSFLGREVHVRRGVAYLSYRTKAPIVPLIPLWGARGRPELHFYDPIVPGGSESREEFEERCLHDIYGRLEQKVLERPDQWEMWPRFFKWLSPPPKLNQGEAVEDRLESLVERLRETLHHSPEQEVRVSPEEAFVLHVRGRRVFVDSRNFRFFLTAPATEETLHYLHRGTTLGELTRRLERKYPRETTLRELARLELLNLLRLQTQAA